MKPENTDTPPKEDCPPAPCSPSFEIFQLRDLALRALPKREMIRLLTLAGIPPVKSKDRRRELMASRLAHIADSVTLVIRWDHRMPNAGSPARELAAQDSESLTKQNG